MLFIFGLIFLAFFISVFYFTQKIKDCECIDKYNKSKLLYIKIVSIILFIIVTINLYFKTRKFSGGGADPTYVLTLIIYYIVILPIIIIYYYFIKDLIGYMNDKKCLCENKLRLIINNFTNIIIIISILSLILRTEYKSGKGKYTFVLRIPICLELFKGESLWPFIYFINYFFSGNYYTLFIIIFIIICFIISKFIFR